MEQLRIRKGMPYPLGATVKNQGTNFSMVNASKDECGVILYQKQTKETLKIPFEEKHRIGNISCFYIEGLKTECYDYNFYIGDREIVDIYAKRVIGNEIWGRGQTQELSLRSGFYVSHYDWKKEKRLHIPYAESVFYCMHIRSFTQHSSAKVKHHGTFEGIVEKIPYLKELGVTAVELLPCYEFVEFDTEEDKSSMQYQLLHFREKPIENVPKKMNYWGFKEAYYFAPKASYAAGDDPCESFKNMVTQLHQNGMEVIMQFYFPKKVKQGYILEVMKHWVMEYHIDGIHLKGEQIPVTLLATEPLFANVKIMCKDFSLSDIYYEDEKPPAYKNLGYYRDEFMHDTRCFLKGDADMLRGVQYHLKNQNPDCGIVNYMTNYNGFTMADLVSYDRKHNEANGENNTDGTEYNYSWNCGVEGPTRKKHVMQLRRKQIRNAFMLLLTAQGTPLILAGDEFGNSQEGNNNCYCQDNEISWLDWNLLKKNKEQFRFVKDLITFRKEHPMLHKEEMLTMTDRFGYGYPDISYHGKEAWKAELENYNRHLAVLYCGRYAKKKDKTDDEFIYLAYNMYWESIAFALPTLPAGYEWCCVADTQQESEQKVFTNKVTVAQRSAMILIGKKKTMLKRATGR